MWSLDEKDFVGESESHRFYLDRFSTKYLKTDNKVNLIKPLKKWSVLVAVDKLTDEKNYVIHDGETIVDDTEDLNQLSFKCDLYKALHIFNK